MVKPRLYRRGRLRKDAGRPAATCASARIPSVLNPKVVVISPTMWFEKAAVLGDFEQLVLLGVLRLELEDASYGAAIRQEIHARSGRDVSINAVYTTLDRLESKGLLKSWVGEPTPQRGGRRRKFYALRPAGVAALRQAYRALTAMADGLQSRLEMKPSKS